MLEDLLYAGFSICFNTILEYVLHDKTASLSHSDLVPCPS